MWSSMTGGLHFQVFNMKFEGIVLTKCCLRRPAVFVSRGFRFQISLYYIYKKAEMQKMNNFLILTLSNGDMIVL